MNPIKVEVNFENVVVKRFAGKETMDKVAGKVDSSLMASQSIREYVDKCKSLYDTRRGLNEKTNAVTMWASIFVICVVIGSTFYQVTSLKRFFLQRKMI